MILAGQCQDPYVVSAPIDFALLWEDRMNSDPPVKTDSPYREKFVARLEDPNNPPPLRRIPSWWKDPANRAKIVHVVHNCDERLTGRGP